jgi:hypothetical protein
LKYKEPTSPKIPVLEQELVRAEAESLVAEAQLSNITREKVKAAFNYQFDAIREHCEKLAIIAGYGKHLLELIDDTPVTPGEIRDSYDGYEASRAYVKSAPFLFAKSNVTCRIIQDCEDALTNWVPQHAAISSKLSQRARTLSLRRTQREHDRIDLSHQDRPIDGESWIEPKGEYEEHEETANNHEHMLDEDEHRGREEERAMMHA